MITDFQPIAHTSPQRIIEREIGHLQPLLRSLRGSLALYTFRSAEAPALMREVARLREQAFRLAGTGTGRALDMDEGDVAHDGYRQIVAWDERLRRVVGGYRYMIGNECNIDLLSTHHYFHFSPAFQSCYLPHAIELGRSFSVRATASALFVMGALWRGLGRIVVQQDAKYLFGKVTIPPHYDRQALRLLLLFLRKFFPAREPLITARQPLRLSHGEDPFVCAHYNENFALLEHLLRSRGERIPPMIHAYMRLSERMQTFDAMVNPDFSGAVEVAILLPVGEIVATKREAYIK